MSTYNVLIITPEEIKLNSRVEINVDDKSIRDLVIITQDTKLVDILGLTLYQRVINGIYELKMNNTPIDADLLALIPYIKPYLRSQVVADFIMVNHYKLTNKGTFKLNDDNGTSANNGEIEWYRSFYDNATASYKMKLVKYLSDVGLVADKNTDQSFEFRGVYLDTGYDDCSRTNLVQGSGESGAGFQGPRGFVGDQGFQGFKGDFGGPQGFQGLQGFQGNQGLQGMQGFQGNQGFQGLIGYQGAGGTIAYNLSYYSTQDQPAVIAGTAMSFNTLDFEFGISVQNQTEITFTQVGTYNIQFSAQLSKTDSGKDYVWIWLRKNGQNVAWSNSSIELDGNQAKTLAAWNWLVEANPSDKYEIMWASDDLSVELHADTPVVGPEIPSVILTVSQVTYTQVGPQGFQGNQGFQGRQGFQGPGFNAIATPADNRVLTSDGSTNAAVAEPNLTFNGSTLAVVGGITSTTASQFATLSGNVGIGTVAPAVTGNFTSLEIKGRVPTNGGTIGLNTSDNSRIGSFYVDQNGLTLGAATNHYVRFITNNLPQGIIQANGNWGIGTTADIGFKLDVAGTLRNTLGANLATTSGNVVIGSLSAGTYKFQIETDVNSGQGIYSRNSNTGALAISSIVAASAVGDISINAYNASHAVWANTSLINSTSGLIGGMVLFQGGASPIAFWTNSSERMRILANGNVLLSSLAGSGVRMVTADASGVLSATIANPVGGTGSANFVTKWSGTSTQTNSQIFDNGTNVSIGAGSASVQKLYVRQDAASYTTIAVDNANAAAPDTGAQFGLYNGGSLVAWFRTVRDGTGNADIGFPNALRFIGASTGTPTERMRISSDGIVGINTTTPTTNTRFRLDVNGDILVNGHTIGRGASSIASNIGIGPSVLQSATSTSSHTIAIGQNTISAAVSGAGNIGIGSFVMGSLTGGGENTIIGFAAGVSIATASGNTSVGRASLNQTTASSNTALGYFAGFNNTTGTNNIFIGNNTQGASASESNRTWIGNSSTTSTWVGGNLLLGTTTDAGFRLQVTSNALTTARFSSSLFDGGIDVQNTGTLAANRTSQIRLVNGSTVFGASDRTYQLFNIGESATASAFAIQYYDGANYSERLRINSNGNVGIRTTTPASLLHVDAPATGGGAIFSRQGFNYASVSQLGSSTDAIFGGGVIASSVNGEMVKTVDNPANYMKLQITDGISFHTGVTGSIGTAVPRLTNLRMLINTSGTVSIASLAGTGVRMVTADATGVLSATIANPVGGTGSANFVTKWNGISTQTNSIIRDNGTSIGIATDISSWQSPFRVLEFPQGVSIISSANIPTATLITNAYVNTIGNAVYKVTGYAASRYEQVSGLHRWFNAPSGNADTNITWTESMRITNAGRVLMGSPINDAGAYELQVAGIIYNTAGAILAATSGSVAIGTTSITSPGAIHFGKSAYGAPGSEDFYRIKLGDVGGIANDVGIGMPTVASLGFNATAATGYHAFFIGGTEISRFDSSGNLGIGITGPAFKLDVIGDARINTIRVGRGLGDISSNTIVGNGGLAANTTGSSNSGFGVSVLAANTTGERNSAFGSSALASNTTGTFNSAFGFDSLRTNISGISNSAFGQSALYSTTGNSNVGVGLNAMYSNSTGSNNTAIGTNAGRGTNANTTGSNNIFIGFEAYGVSASQSNRTWIGNSSTTSTWVGGNLLVGGTTDNGYRLQTYGEMYAAVTSDAPVMRLDGSGSNFVMIARGGAQRFVNINEGLTIGTSYQTITPPADGLVVEGNVGIGVSNPAYKLDVVGGIGARNSFVVSVNPSTGDSTGVQNYLNYGDVFVSGIRDMTLSTSSAERMRISSTGNVGIGLTGPAYKLDVSIPSSGTVARFASLGNAIVRIERTGASPGVTTLTQADSGEFYINAPTRQFWQIGGSNRMILFDTGNFGIGTTADIGFKLDVAGTLRNTLGANLATTSGGVTIGSTALPLSGLDIYGNTSLDFGVFRAQQLIYSVSAFNASPNASIGFVNKFTTAGGYGTMGGISVGKENATDGNAAGYMSFVTYGPSSLSEKLRITSTGNVLIGATAVGTSAAKVIAVGSGTAPSSSPADAIQMYSADIVAGNAAPHFRTENGAVVKIYQETTGIAEAAFTENSGGTAVNVDSTFGGYTLQQVVQALKNLGILA